jgi:CHRD domain-containing protein/PEP-CTERM motif-containing protein
MLRSLIASCAAAVLLCGAGAAQSSIFVYTASMSGANETPPTVSPAFGFTTVTVDDVLNSLNVDITYSGLVGGPPVAGHIHCCVAPGSNVGVAVGFIGFPTTTSGSYNHTFNLLDSSIYTSSFLTTFGGGTAAGAEAALLQGLAAGNAYSNIHNAVYPGGEIRGLLTAAVPEPQAWMLMLAGFGLAGAALRRRRTAFA